MTQDIVEVFADVACPFADVGLRRFVARRTELGSSVPVLRVRAWPLERVNGEPVDPDTTADHVDELRRQVTPNLFEHFSPTAVPATSFPAFELVAQASLTSEALGETVSLAVRTALFEAGRDIADPTVLAEIAKAHGVGEPGAEARDLVVADYEDGQRRGVEGSPEFIVGGRGYFCPSLRIEESDDGLDITVDPERFEAMLAKCFGL